MIIIHQKQCIRKRSSRGIILSIPLWTSRTEKISKNITAIVFSNQETQKDEI